MKRKLALIFALIMCLCLTACNGTGQSGKKDSHTAKSPDELETNPETGKIILDFSNENIYIIVKDLDGDDHPDIYMNGINTPIPKEYLGKIKASTIKYDDGLHINFERVNTIQYNKMHYLFDDTEYDPINTNFLLNETLIKEGEYLDPSKFTTEELLEQLYNYTDDKILAFGFYSKLSGIYALIEKENEDGSFTYYYSGNTPCVVDGNLIFKLGKFFYDEDNIVSYEEGYKEITTETKDYKLLYLNEE